MPLMFAALWFAAHAFCNTGHWIKHQGNNYNTQCHNLTFFKILSYKNTKVLMYIMCIFFYIVVNIVC